MKFFFVKTELAQRAFTLRAIPGIAEENSTYIPKNCGELGHGDL
jgi:hypothetical protein